MDYPLESENVDIVLAAAKKTATPEYEALLLWRAVELLQREIETLEDIHRLTPTL